MAHEPHRQPFFAIDPMNPLPIHHPPFTPQHAVPAQRATLRAHWGQLSQPQAQRRIIPLMVR